MGQKPRRNKMGEKRNIGTFRCSCKLFLSFICIATCTGSWYRIIFKKAFKLRFFLVGCILLFSQVYTLRFLESFVKSVCMHYRIQLDVFTLSGLLVSFGMDIRTKKIWRFFCAKETETCLSRVLTLPKAPPESLQMVRWSNQKAPFSF